MDVSLLCSTPVRPLRFFSPFAPSRRRTSIAIVTASDRIPPLKAAAAASRPRIASSSMQASSSTSSSIPPGDALVLVPGDGVEAPARWLAPFCAALDSDRSVWLWFGDLPPSAPLPDTVLPALSAACAAAARVGKPMANFVPLVPRLAAQGDGKVWKVLGGEGGGEGEGDDREEEGEAPPSSPSSPPSLASVLVGSEGQRERASALAQRIERARESPSSSPVAVAVVAAAEPGSSAFFPASLPVPVPAAAAVTAAPAAAAAGETASPPPPPSPPFDQVAVGGTFDRLHAGHRLLLAASALAAERRLFVGVTGDKLLASKRHAELLQPFDERAAAAVAYVRKVRPSKSLSVDVGALLDPKEPTGAETEEGMQALVVSRETVAGGEAINAGRERRGFGPLALLVVGLVGSSGSDGGGGGGGGAEQGGGNGGDVEGKISSTDLRAAEAAARKKS